MPIPASAASVAFRMPGMMNGMAPAVKAVLHDRSPLIFSQTTPNSSVTKEPMILAKIAYAMLKFVFFDEVSCDVSVE